MLLIVLFVSGLKRKFSENLIQTYGTVSRAKRKESLDIISENRTRKTIIASAHQVRLNATRYSILFEDDEIARK
jgi:hypothetical protein